MQDFRIGNYFSLHYSQGSGVLPVHCWRGTWWCIWCKMEIPKEAKPKHVQISYEAMKLVAPGIDGNFLKSSSNHLDYGSAFGVHLFISVWWMSVPRPRVGKGCLEGSSITCVHSGAPSCKNSGWRTVSLILGGWLQVMDFSHRISKHRISSMSYFHQCPEHALQKFSFLN